MFFVCCLSTASAGDLFTSQFTRFSNIQTKTMHMTAEYAALAEFNENDPQNLCAAFPCNQLSELGFNPITAPSKWCSRVGLTDSSVLNSNTACGATVLSFRADLPSNLLFSFRNAIHLETFYNVRGTGALQGQSWTYCGLSLVNQPDATGVLFEIFEKKKRFS